MRFLSHRDVARSFEWALRRSGLPVARSHGFSPHPRLSWVGAAPTGAASEAEYVEIGLAAPVQPPDLHRDLDAALPSGLDVLEVVPASPGRGSLAQRIDAALWRIELPSVPPGTLQAALAKLLAETQVEVQRPVKDGTRRVAVRAALVSAQVHPEDTLVATREGPGQGSCATMDVVVRQATPAVRPDDVLGALQLVAGLQLAVPAKATRLAQGLLDDRGRLADPLQPDRVPTRAEPERGGADLPR